MDDKTNSIVAKKEQELNKREAALSQKESDIDQRELKLKVAEETFQKQFNALEQKNRESQLQQNDIELQKNALRKRELDLKATRETLHEQEAFINKKRLNLEELELKAKNNFQALFESRFADFKKGLEERESACLKEQQAIEAQKEQLRQRELNIQKAETIRDNDFADKRALLDDELFNIRQKQEKDLILKRSQHLQEMEQNVQNERNSRFKQLDKELTSKLNAFEEGIKTKQEKLEQEKIQLEQKRAHLDEMNEELEYQKQRLQARKEALKAREQDLNKEVELKSLERKQSYDAKEAQFNEEIERLRDSLKTSSSLISSFEELGHKLGNDDPANVLLKLKTYEENIASLRKALNDGPTPEMQEAFDRLHSEKETLQRNIERLSEENNDLRKEARAQAELEMHMAELTDLNTSLKRRFEAIEADNNQLHEKLKRMLVSYSSKQNREERIKKIEEPYLTNKPTSQDFNGSELDWLNHIDKRCIDYGQRFPRRILHAFHTALKTSELSPITVLAGVSGTGKSTLPLLYSHFGGLNFKSISVQPNWDSQESMLGFFNSIDNQFDAQPVLRILTQTQKHATEDYPYGLKDVMTLLLLDEMNLAYVELYFAQFLSKLEERRGVNRDNLPSLEVKIGIDEFHKIPLGRNVLWAGTMNQDETTKSLSDKVLDRGIVINFPRPITLERRSLKDRGEPWPLLHKNQYQSWWCKESKFTNEQILPFKGFIEDMNSHLSQVGRAMGHRVWQSIEYYMANYPDVMEAQRNKDETLIKKAMEIAFEDQLVQKVMPKLRGIETRGKSKTECLDKIRSLLVDKEYAIIEDFDLACEFGYGQFMWNSANYLKEDEQHPAEKDNTKKTENG
ncbi:MAG: chromosome partitioning protein ParA [Proteobacteria bacterium]|nr:chromosome partitioning protein ParA [Pseudomonadota bacterium]